jgi:hypothetical protein
VERSRRRALARPAPGGKKPFGFGTPRRWAQKGRPDAYQALLAERAGLRLTAHITSAIQKLVDGSGVESHSAQDFAEVRGRDAGNDARRGRDAQVDGRQRRPLVLFSAECSWWVLYVRGRARARAGLLVPYGDGAGRCGVVDLTTQTHRPSTPQDLVSQ